MLVTNNVLNQGWNKLRQYLRDEELLDRSDYVDNNLYDYTNPISIYEYSKELIGKTFNDICKEDNLYVKESATDIEQYGNRKRKGGLGELVEEMHFKYKANNDIGPDFKEAGLELKVTPYKINKNKSTSSKERMIITMINYFKLAEEGFYESNLWDKSKLILIIFYLWEKEIKDRLDYKINYVHLYSPPKEDLKIIIEDYKKIQKKVIEGKAHELSEGDTMYLGAATKAASSKNLRNQPFSEIQAKPRAFSFKSSYMTYILNNYVISQAKDKYAKKQEKISSGEEHDTFENYVLNRINSNIGLDDIDLFKKYYRIESSKDLNKIMKSKGRYSNLAFRMLGVKSNRAEEFEKANVVVKSIRVEESGKIKESISFPTFKIKDLVQETWEESTAYNYFSETKFLFMVFNANNCGGYYLKKAFFWNMPIDIIENEVKDDWEIIVDRFRNGIILKPTIQKGGKVVVKNNLPSKKELNILHVRPHATKSIHLINGKEYGNGRLTRDSDELLNGDRMTKQCFWLNNDYLKDIINRT